MFEERHSGFVFLFALISLLIAPSPAPYLTGLVQLSRE